MIKKGRGIATVYYPTGFNGGGDADLVSLSINRDGTILMSNGSCEMGQGFKTVAVQMAAEALEIEVDKVSIDNTNTDTAAFSMDTAGSRTTYVVGLAAISAAEDLIKKMKMFAAGMLECDTSELKYENGEVFKKSDPALKVTLGEIGTASTYGGQLLMGNGGFLPPPGPPRDPETGATVPSRTMAWGSSVIDVQVDDETGVVEVVNVYNCYDIGTVINPMTAEGQVEGGMVLGIGMAMFEDVYPHYPEKMDINARDFTDYIIPTSKDMPNCEIEFYENYDPYGPFGAKGCGEMVSNTQSPAIVNAIHDALGIWVDSLPATPEKILRLLEQQQSA